jgi:predicted secreted Zn-dependent protease
VAIAVAGCSSSPRSQNGESTPSATLESQPKALATAVSPDVQLRINTATEYYPVYGSNSEQILNYLRANGPLSDGERAVGVASAKPSREWKSRQERGSCSIASMTITVDITVTLPRLENSASLATLALRYWQSFAKDVAEHEQRHVDIYTTGFEEMKGEMLEIGSRPTCAQLETEISRTWDARLEIINGRQEEFHRQENARAEGLRAPLLSQISANRARVATINTQIATTDQNLDSLTAQIDSVEKQLDHLKTQLDAIQAAYPNLALPEPQFSQFQSLRNQYNGLVPVHTALVNQYNALLGQRRDLVSEHNNLVSLINQQVEEVNWLP